MKYSGKILKLALAAILAIAGPEILQAQSLKDLMKGKNNKDTTSKGADKLLDNVTGLLNQGKKGNLSAGEVAAGLKEALEKGVDKGTAQLALKDGFLGDAMVKILLPPEAKKVEESLRRIGLNRQVDEAIQSLNRAAEDAASAAAPIFLNAIKQMTIQDAFAILGGKEDAATQYLSRTTSAALTTSFRPIIEKSLEKVDATRHWNTIFSTYNKLSPDKVNPDLPAYVTEKAMEGVFKKIAAEEASIRKDPLARTSNLLKKVFNQAN
jgi:hypothetical protein